MYFYVENLKKSFINKIVLNDISFGLDKGKLLCILGESGCGKTTTLNLIGGFLKSDNGKIFLDDEDITNKEPNERPTATVFQNYGLFPNMTVLENIVYGLKIKGVEYKQRIKKGLEYVALVSLNGYENQNVEKISGGQKQRVALARALITNPKLLLLDEPFSNLDLNLRIKMRKEIKNIQKETKTTMIFVTHDIEEAITIADYIIIMNNGYIVAKGNPIQIFKEEQNEYVKNFLNMSNYKIDENNHFYKILI